MSETILKVAGVSKRFGGLQALSDVGIHIERGQVYGLIGPNGAGKTTFFNVLTGLYTPDSGTFELAGKPYQPSAVHEVAKAGIARYLAFYNSRRPHQSLDGQTPDALYFNQAPLAAAA